MTTTPAPTAHATEADRFAIAREVADAVLFEGYVLYPYRASAAKNQLRWQFGVLVPGSSRADEQDGEGGAPDGEHSAQRTELLMEPRGEDATVDVELRFLHTQRRTVQRRTEEGRYEDTASLALPDRDLVAWDEGVEARAAASFSLTQLLDGTAEFTVRRAAAEETESVAVDGRVIGRLVRRREPIQAVLRLSAVELPGPYRVYRLAVEVSNTARSRGSSARSSTLPRSLVSTHLLLGLSAGGFLSQTDPPEWARTATAECRSEHTWPVLIGGESGESRANVVLSSPIILEDHPKIAPESPGALYDSTEIDEILTLRTATLTEQEKREARGTDARAGAVIDLAESMPPEVLDRLHGAVRALEAVTGPPSVTPEEPLTLTVPGGQPETPWWDPGGDRGVDPETDTVLVDGFQLGAGARVRLRPGTRRTDAQDLFLHGHTALVEAVLKDVDGGVHLAVTLDVDPGADVRREQGRYLYFQPDEVEPLEEAK